MTKTPADLKAWNAKPLGQGIDAAGAALWSWTVDTGCLTMDERSYDLRGVPVGRDVRFDDLPAHIHPAGRDRVRAASVATRGILGRCEMDVRIVFGDERPMWTARL